MPENRFGHLRLVSSTSDLFAYPNGSLPQIPDEDDAEREMLEDLGFSLTEMTPEMARELLLSVVHPWELVRPRVPARSFLRLAHVTATPLAGPSGERVAPSLRVVGEG